MDSGYVRADDDVDAAVVGVAPFSSAAAFSCSNCLARASRSE